MLKKRRGEIGTVVMFIALAVMTIIGLSSSRLLSKKQTTSTKAAVVEVICNAANKYNCSPNTFCDSDGTPCGEISQNTGMGCKRCVGPNCIRSQSSNIYNFPVFDDADPSLCSGEGSGGTGNGTTNPATAATSSSSSGVDSRCANKPGYPNACCVVDTHYCNGEFRYRWYGCTGAPCEATIISTQGGPGHLIVCPDGVTSSSSPDGICEPNLPKPASPPAEKPFESCLNFGRFCRTDCGKEEDTKGYLCYNDKGRLATGGPWCCKKPRTPPPAGGEDKCKKNNGYCAPNIGDCEGRGTITGEAKEYCVSRGEKFCCKEAGAPPPDGGGSPIPPSHKGDINESCLFDGLKDPGTRYYCNTELRCDKQDGTGKCKPITVSPGQSTNAIPIPPTAEPTLDVLGGCNSYSCSNDSNIKYSTRCANSTFGRCGGDWYFYGTEGCGGNFTLTRIQQSTINSYCKNTLRNISVDIILKSHSSIPFEPTKPRAVFSICFDDTDIEGTVVSICPVEKGFDLSSITSDGYPVKENFKGTENNLKFYLRYNPVGWDWQNTLSGLLEVKDGKITGDVDIN